MSDVRDILEIELPAAAELTKESIISGDKRNRKRYEYNKTPKRPEGMHREVYALLCKDGCEVPPIFPTDTAKGYKQIKAKLGMKKARAWKWTPFTNPARTDGAVFHHWRRVTDADTEYPFAAFNRKVPVPSYGETEYSQHLVASDWTKAETDHLFDLCRQFDLRFIVMQDRWDRSRFTARSVNDLKNRYYQVCGALQRAKNPHEKVYTFDYDHECKRKEQLKKLFERSKDQIDEEQMLVSELRKIEQRKKERERKTQDLQKLITAADSNQADSKKSERKNLKKSTTSSRQKINRVSDATTVFESTGIKFPDIKSCGVSLRSQKIKLPSSLGQKKIKGIENTLAELGLEINPPPTEPIWIAFNELRNDIVLHWELKGALASCDFELQSLRHQYEAIAPGKTLLIPQELLPQSNNETRSEETNGSVNTPSAFSN